MENQRMVENHLAHTIGQTENEARYDKATKKLPANKLVLAHIMKGCVEEYRSCPVHEIAEKYIEGEPEIGTVGVHADDTNRVHHSTADSTISGIILTGTGARLIGLPPVLAGSINKMVRIGDPFIRFKLSKEVERQNIVAHAVDLGGVLGLVIGKKPR